MQASQISEQPPRATDPKTSSNSSISGRFAVRCVLAILVTFAGVQYSMRHGRLLRQPVGDDGDYMVDGLRRLEFYFQGGTGAFLRSWMVDPPHAAFSTLLAMASFTVFGRHEWAPYAGNGIIVLGLLTAVDWLAGNVRPWQRGLIYAMVLCTRWPWMAVSDFRPDLATGLLAAVGIIYCLKSPIVGSSPGKRIAVGVFFGLVLIFKPSMAPVNLAILGVCMMTAIGADMILRKPNWREIIAALGSTVLAGLVTASLYFAFGWKATYDYFYINVFGEKKQFWSPVHYTWGEKLGYYLTRPGFAGSLILGTGHVLLLIALAVVGLALVFHRGNRSQKVRALGLLFVGIVAYAIPTLAKTKNFFFGLDFQTLMLLAAVLTLRWLLILQKPLATAAFVVTCLASIVMFQPPRYLADPWTPATIDSNRLLGEIYGAVQQGQIGDRIFAPVSGGLVSVNTLNYLSLCDDSLRRFFIVDFWAQNDRALTVEQLDQADWVVVGDRDKSVSPTNSPTERDAQAVYRDNIQAMPEFSEVNTFPVAGGTAYHVFRRTTPAFTGFVESESQGLGGPDGPHSQWRLPITRAAMGQLTRLAIAPGAGHRVIILSFTSLIDDEKISVLLNGKPLAAKRYDKDASFSDMCLPVELPEGKNELEIRCSRWSRPDGGGPGVLFKKIQILAETDDAF